MSSGSPPSVDENALFFEPPPDLHLSVRDARSRWDESLGDESVDGQHAVHVFDLIALAPQALTDRLRAARAAGRHRHVLIGRPAATRDRGDEGACAGEVDRGHAGR
jgi:hypothetical protein